MKPSGSRIAAIFAVLACSLSAGIPSLAITPAHADDLAAYVNPFVGTQESHRGFTDIGSTFPGAAVSFGMLQWSPDTDNPLAGGYNYDGSEITGFSLRHLSGTGCSYTAYGDFPVMPTTSPPSGPFAWSQVAAPLAHDHESAAPGSFHVLLGDGITIDLSVGERFGVGSFVFPDSTGSGSVLIDAARAASAPLDSSIDVVAPDTITGEHISGRFCTAPLHYHMYVAVRFDRPFASFGTWATAPQGSPLPVDSGGVAVPGATHGTGAWATFDTSSNHIVRVKIGISFVSRANALANLDIAPSWDVDTVAASARTRWNDLLGRVRVSGGTDDDMHTFYTALYHAFLHPSAFSDANGEYIGYDGKVHITGGYTHYTDFSGWDTYRSLIQLQSLVAPREVNDMIRSLLSDAAQGGWLPRWGFANYDTGVMVGDPADAIIANAYAFGVHDFDQSAALQAMLKGANQTGLGPWGQTVSRPGLKDYVRKGYIPLGAEQTEQLDEASSEESDAARNYIPAGILGVWGPTATTMEYAIADFAIAQFARAVGDNGTAAEFDRRAQSWQNVFNPATGYSQPKKRNDTWSPAFSPEHMVGFTEGNAAQYTFLVPQNVRGVINALGGDGAAIARLDDLFSQINVGPLVAHAWLGDEPGIGTPYAYLYAGAPWKTQALLRRVLRELYGSGPDGLPGNDDLGSLSAEYVWGALGLHPSMPGSAELLVSSPLFPDAQILLPNSKTLEVSAAGAAEGNFYLQALSLDGAEWTRPWLPASVVQNGGELDFTLGNAADTSWGAATDARPPSSSAGEANAIGYVDPPAITLQPGQSATVNVGAVNATDNAQVVSWSIAAGNGLTVAPSTGTISLGPAGRSVLAVTVTASQTAIDGQYVVPIEMNADDGPAMPRMVLSVTVSRAP